MTKKEQAELQDIKLVFDERFNNIDKANKQLQDSIDKAIYKIENIVVLVAVVIVAAIFTYYI